MQAGRNDRRLVTRKQQRQRGVRGQRQIGFSVSIVAIAKFYSTRAPESLTTRAYFAISDLM
jgi:hypothetical protein